MTFIPGVYNVPLEAPVQNTQSGAGPSVPASARARTGTLTPADLGVNAEEAHLVGKGGCMGSEKTAGVPSLNLLDSDDDDNEPPDVPDPDVEGEACLQSGDAEEQERYDDDLDVEAETRIPTGDAEVEDRDEEEVDYEPEPDEVPLEDWNPRYVNPPLSQVAGEKGTDSLGFGNSSPTIHEQETPPAQPLLDLDQEGPPKTMQVPLSLRPDQELVVRVAPTQEPAVSIEGHLPPAAVGGPPTADEQTSSNPTAKSKGTVKSIAFVNRGVKGATRMIGPDEHLQGKTRAAKRSKTDGTAQASSLVGNLSRDSSGVQEGEESSGKGKRKVAHKKTSSKKGTSREQHMSPKKVDAPEDVLSPPRASTKGPRPKKFKGGGQ